MRELAAEYKRSCELLNNRIVDLIRQRDFLAARSLDPEHLGLIDELNDRIKPLREMLNDLREVTREVKHYYDLSWWRSEEYTCNQRKAQPYVYAGPTRC